MKRKQLTATTLENAELAKAVGKVTLTKLIWKSWKKERPKNCQDVFVIIRLKNGYYPVGGTYFDETINGLRFRRVVFNHGNIPDVFLDSKDEKRLIAWAVLEKLGKVLTDAKLSDRLAIEVI
jgi:hypothetical protein